MGRFKNMSSEAEKKGDDAAPTATGPSPAHIQPTACLAQFMLTGTSGWALKHLPKDCYFMMGTFSILLGHSLIGVLNFGHPDSGKTVKKLYEQTSLIVEILPLPFLNAELYAMAGFSMEYTYGHIACAVIPLLTQFISEEHNGIIIDILALGNLSSLAYYASTVDSGPWAGGLLALMTLNSFIFRKISDRFNVPRCDITTVGLCFFSMFGVYCVAEAIN